MKILEQFNTEEIQRKLDDAKSFREFLISIDSSTNGSGAYKSIKSQLVKLGLKTPKYNYVNKEIRKKLKDEDVFVENSTYSRQHLKERIIKNKLIEYKCIKCGNCGIWNNKELSLQLEHLNGINDDNRLTNLAFMCPNCHSQTDTYSGKNKKRKEKNKCKCGKEIFKSSKMCFECKSLQSRKVERPPVDILIEEVKSSSYRAVGRKYGVSDKTIRKWIK